MSPLGSVPHPVGFYKTFSELSKTGFAFDAFMRELSLFRRSEVLEWTASLLQITSEPYGQSIDVQKQLIELCLDVELAKRSTRSGLR